MATASFFEERFRLVGATLARASCPGLSGSSWETDIAFLIEQGVSAIVSLNEADLPWSSLAGRLAHLWIPVADHGAPTTSQMQEIASFWEQHKMAGRVVVHCNAGQGRTGTVLCCLMLLEEPTRTPAEIVAMLDPHLRLFAGARSGSWLSQKQRSFVEQWALLR